MTDITVTDTPHGLHLDTDGGTPVTLSPDTVAAIVQHELGKLGLWWAEEQRAFVVTAPTDDGYIVLLLDGVASGAHWITVEAKASAPLGRRLGGAVAAYLATLPPAVPKPGETWELNPGDESFTAQVVEAPDGTVCFVWCPFDEVAIRRVKGFFEGNRRKIGDAPSRADQ